MRLGSSTSGVARLIETLRPSTRWLTFAAVAVLLIGAVAGCSSGGAVSPSTGASSAPASAAAPQVLPGAGHTPVAIPAGTYAVVVNGTTIPAPTPVIRVPAGYSGAGFAVHTRDKGTTTAPDAHGLSFWEVQSVFNNPCKAGKHGVDPGPDPRRRRLPAGHRRLAHARGHPGADRRDHGDGEDAHVPHHKLTARTPPGSAATGDGPPSPATSSTWTRTPALRARSSTAGGRPAASRI